MAADTQNWHLDKRVSMATIFAIFMQAVALVGGGVWFAGEFRAQIEANSLQIDVNARDIKRNSDGMTILNGHQNEQAVQLGRIETNIDAIKESVDRLVRTLERSNLR
jgi:hypothetical protein